MKSIKVNDPLGQSEVNKNYEARRINEVIVAPLDYISDETTPTSVSIEFTKSLANIISTRTSINVIPISENNIANINGDFINGKQAISQKERAVRLARQASAQGVIYGTVKVPPNININDNAFLSSVAINLWLVDVNGSELMWEFSYSDRNKSLSENILAIDQFMAKGGHSRSTKQMLDAGFSAAADELEVLRGSVFSFSGK
ncbi:MAG: hypothetical protein IT292_00345 [Deltaproteobacteria bacterium]|nr:hypothetical protein [Deltaproteobacteria bacterium]